MNSHTFRAMGSPCRIVVDGGATDLANRAHGLLDQLEQKWSRFLPDSEISRLNRNTGHLTVVSPETFSLIARASEAQALTGGRFNPLMLTQLRHLGYDRPWQDRAAGADSGSSITVQPASAEPIELFPDLNGVRVPAGATFDPGGIGKGLAADIVTAFLTAQGATSSSVELGGDVRVSGEPWFGATWRIGVADPLNPARDIAAFAPHCGAVATSSVLRRRWQTNGEQRHHLLDPATGQPAATNLVSATACSSATWWAEIAAKVALMAGSREALDLLRQFGTPGVVMTADGLVLTTEAEPAMEQGTGARVRELVGT